MKILIVLGISFCTTMIGFGLSTYYKRRKIFFENYIIFLEEFKNQISYKNCNSIKFLTDISTKYNNELSKILSSYVELIKNKQGITKDLLFANNNLLKDEEKDNILIFFQTLGKMDSYSQIDNIDNFKSIINKDYLSSVDEYKKFGPMNTKLGFLIGLAISLLII